MVYASSQRSLVRRPTPGPAHRLARRRAPRLAWAALAAAALCSAPAAAVSRYWSYTAGCSSQDFTGPCWSATLGGLLGASAPDPGSNVFVQQGGAVSLPVSFANLATGRDFSIGALTIEGTVVGSAALSIARNTLTTTGSTIGLNSRGRIDQTGGAHVVNGQLLVGFRDGATGSYNLVGGNLQTVDAFIGVNAGSTGSMVVAGAGTRWTGSQTIVGLFSSGTVGISGGAKFDNGTLRIGATADATGTVTVSGIGTRLTATSTTFVGESGNGRLTADAGATLSTAMVFVGSATGSVGAVVIDGAGTQWTNTGDIDFGGQGGTGSAVVSNGALLTSGGVVMNAGSTLRLAGGTIETAAFARATGSFFDWASGTLHLTGSSGARLGDASLDRATTLLTGQLLQVDNQLVVGAGTVLSLAGGTLKTPALRLVSGSVVASAGHSLNMSDIGRLTGNGSVVAAVRGGSGSSIVTFTGDSLTLGRLDADNAFDYAGSLTVGLAAQVVLLDRTRAQLGSSTSIANDGRLASINGARIGPGQTLVGDGNTSVQGRFTNDGAVRSQAGRLTFFDDVDGSGSFAGNVLFRAGYTPGAGAVRVSFNGGAATFDAYAVLTLQIFGDTPGSQYDQLADIGTLRFDGRLVLDFGSYAPQAGSHFALIGFGSFGGALAADRIDVLGFDRSRLDLSQLAVDGTLSVTAVHEPPGWALGLAGIAALGAAVRRRRGG